MSLNYPDKAKKQKCRSKIIFKKRKERFKMIFTNSKRNFDGTTYEAEKTIHYNNEIDEFYVVLYGIVTYRSYISFMMKLIIVANKLKMNGVKN